MTISNVNKSIVLITRLLDDKKPVKPIYTSSPQKPNFGFSEKKDIKRNTPEGCGIESDRIADFLTKLKGSRDLNMHSVLIGRNGALCCEAVFNNHNLSTLKTTFSQCKSILSLAVGIAIEKGLLTLDTKIIDIFPDDCNAIVRIKLKDLTVEHLLTMTSGVLFNEIECMTETNWVRGFLRSITDNPPGKKFNYNSLNSYMLSAALCKVSGTSLSNFVNENLFAPLGITQFYWEKCPCGFEKGGWGLYISPYDMFKIATLVLNDGVLNGKQIIPADYLKLACSKQISTPADCGDFDYGFHIWVGPNEETFLFNGMFGQNVLCFKKSKIIVISNAGNNEMFQQNTYYKTALNAFSGSFPKKLPANPLANARLNRLMRHLNEPFKPDCFIKRIYKNHQNKKQSLALNGLSFQMNRENSLGLFPVILQAVQNNYSSGLKGISFKVLNKTLNLVYEEAGCSYTIPVGFKEPLVSNQLFFGEPYLINCIGRFSTNEDLKQVLVIDINLLETPCTKRLKFQFDDDFCVLCQSENPGKPLLDLTLNSFKSNIPQIPILAPLFDKFDEDLAGYKVERLFSPKVVLKKK